MLLLDINVVVNHNSLSNENYLIYYHEMHIMFYNLWHVVEIFVRKLNFVMVLIEKYTLVVCMVSQIELFLILNQSINIMKCFYLYKIIKECVDIFQHLKLTSFLFTLFNIGSRNIIRTQYTKSMTSKFKFA